ncbi:MAG: FAD/NAD(P)-binding oxidoreductase [Planctomycetota bacterium]|nr:MAG: FAD/NAD(P)-binding oxidoreductase [Planctomycetota bacterium]
MNALDAITSPLAFKILGLAIAALVLLSLAGSLVGSLLRSRRAARRARHELEEFRARIELARAAAEKQREQAALSWQGYRKFEVRRRQVENLCGDICSFYLYPHDRRPLPEFLPGQFLTFRLDVPGQRKPITRCYSLSAAYEREFYRVSIKRIAGRTVDGHEQPPGVASNFFHDHVKEGDILDVKAPAGKFVLDVHRGYPVVLIGGGVGITPVLSMFETLARAQPNRPALLFYGVRSSDEVVLGSHLVELAQGSAGRKVFFCYSKPNERDQGYIARTQQAVQAAIQGAAPWPEVYHLGSRVTGDLVKGFLPGESAVDTHHFYICGPGPMLLSLTSSLQEWGVPEGHVHYEAFGPSTVKRAAKTSQRMPVQSFQVSFSRSGKTAVWTPESESLLDLAEQEGVDVDSGCRAGDCHSCKVAIKSGEVSYLKDPPEAPEAGSALLCVAVPKGDLVIDA